MEDREFMSEKEKMVIDTIEKLRKYLQHDGGDIEYVGLRDGIVYVHMLGACAGCSLIDVTLKDGVEQVLIEEVPGIVEVRAI